MTETFDEGHEEVLPEYQVRPTLIEIILDESGSMAEHFQQTLVGFNAFLKDQRAVPGQTLVTLTTFETYKNQYTPYVDLDIGMVPDLSKEMYRPQHGGGTNLYDTILARYAAINQRITTWAVKPHVLVLVITDGLGDVSDYGPEDVKICITAAQQQQNWTGVYLGPKGSREYGVEMGFLPGNIREFEMADIKSVMADVSTATTVFRTHTTLTADAAIVKHFFGEQ